jgi:RNA polymerase sigma-70 factor (ECF subfamily)
VADEHQAQDLTQEFFARLMEKDMLAAATPTRGRFRSFLLTSFKNFLSNEWEKAQAQKRGGGHKLLSIQFDDRHSSPGFEPSHDLTPERVFEREWTLTLLSHVVERLAGDMRSAGKEHQFELLKGTLSGEKDVPYADIASQLDMTPDAARQAAHRLRNRYRDILREEVASTLANPAEVEDEIRSLFAALS